MRRKAGKTTYGQCGDICSTHPSGNSLTELVTMELKRGYSKYPVSDLLEGKGGPWFGFFEQAMKAADNAKTEYWWLIVRQDRKEAMLYMPLRMAADLNRITPLGKFPHLALCIRVRKFQSNVMGFRLRDFLWSVSPENMIIGCKK